MHCREKRGCEMDYRETHCSKIYCSNERLTPRQQND